MNRDQWIESAEALLHLDEKKALAPHGIGGHARTLLEEAVTLLRAHNSDSAEPAAWRTEKGDGEVAVHSLVVGGVLCRWWGDVEPDGVSILNSALASPPAKDVADSANFHDYDAGLLSDYGGGNVDWWMDYIRTEISRANEFWRVQVEALTNRTPDDEVGNG